MFKAAKISTLLQFALCLLAFSIPLKFIFSTVCLIIVAILWIMQGSWKQAFKNIRERKALWAWPILYSLLIISYFYSSDKSQAAFDLKIKLAYLILPLMIGAGLSNLSRKAIEQVFLSLITGVVVCGIIALIHATIVWYPEKYFYAFFYHELVDLTDPNAVYTAWYCIFSIAMLLFMPWYHYFQGIYKAVRYTMLVFLLVFFVLLSARMFILLFVLFIVPYFIKVAFKNKTRGLIVAVLSIISIYFTYNVVEHTNNPIKKRYSDMLNSDLSVAWLDDYSEVEEGEMNNVALRIFLWRLGVESVRDNNAWLTGLGNGDVHNTLREKMRSYKVQNIDNPDETKRPGFANANLHNMFIQTLVMIGIPGLLVLLWAVVFPVFYMHKVAPFQPFLVFHITSILFMMQEAVLQTQAGIFFYMLILSMFWGMYYNEKKVKIY